MGMLTLMLASSTWSPGPKNENGSIKPTGETESRPSSPVKSIDQE
jgi:hypothetical protein